MAFVAAVCHASSSGQGASGPTSVRSYLPGAAAVAAGVTGRPGWPGSAAWLPCWPCSGGLADIVLGAETHFVRRSSVPDRPIPSSPSSRTASMHAHSFTKPSRLPFTVALGLARSVISGIKNGSRGHRPQPGSPPRHLGGQVICNDSGALFIRSGAVHLHQYRLLGDTGSQVQLQAICLTVESPLSLVELSGRRQQAPVTGRRVHFASHYVRVIARLIRIAFPRHTVLRDRSSSIT
jgi:hypothetical protein